MGSSKGTRTLTELGRNPGGMPWKPNEWSVAEEVMDHIKATDRSYAPNKSDGMRTEKYSLHITMWRLLMTLIRAVLEELRLKPGGGKCKKGNS